MRSLPKMLFTISLFAIAYCLLPIACPIHAQEVESQTEQIGDIDKTDPGVGEKIERSVNVSIGGEVSPLTIGVQQDEFQFPDLTQLDKTTSGAIPFLLPEEWLEQYKPPEPKKLEGKIYHPVCKFDEKSPDPNKNLSTGVSFVQTPDWWVNTLAVTKLAQAIGIPSNDSGVKFETFTGAQVLPGDDPNKPLPSCLPVSLTSDSEINPDASVKQTHISLTSLKDIIREIVRRITEAIGSIPVQVTAQSKKFVQGQTEFAEQTSRDEGFLRAFCPEDGCPKENQLNAKILTPYVEDTDGEDVAFQGVAGAQVTYDDYLVAGLYPEDAQGIIAPFPGGAYPITGGSDKLDYTLPYMDANYPLSEETKRRLIEFVEKNPKWPKSKIRQLWDQVVAQSRAAGVNPAFTITIWLEESGAGGHPDAQSDFGCFPRGDTNQTIGFDRSLSCFLGFTNDHSGDFTEWVRWFCGPNTPTICSNNPGFIGRLRSVWGQVTQ